MTSSQLASQLFSKDITWQILIDKYPAKIWYRTPPKDLKIEIWANCVYVHLPKSDQNAYDGFSLFISFNDYLEKFALKTAIKAHNLNAIQVRKTIFSVSSSQGQTAERYTVNAAQFGMTCDCMLYKCLRSRLHELPASFKKVLKINENFKGQFICHHIEAVIAKLNCYDLADYLESKKT